MESKIIMSGSIVSELSEKIPSNIVALNELIKNSYDAGVESIKIILDSEKKKLIVKDDGSGMNQSDIDNLFHISKSEKKYGTINQYGRYTQGSKGLGFLSVFKFGEIVTWKTKKDNGLEFSVNYSELIKYDDVSKYRILITENNLLSKGTEIQIDISDYNLESLLNYFSEEKNYMKIINSFNDKNVIIELQIDDLKFYNKDISDLKIYLPERQLYFVQYDSDTEEVRFYYNNILVFSKNYKINSKSYKLEIELMIFQFKPRDKSKISSLFYDTKNNLTPLVYINSNLFNNYDLFDPEIMRNIKFKDVLNQIIGYIKIISDDPLIDFNSDRTHFIQNSLTDIIKKDLMELNKLIQHTGSEYKKYLVDFKILKEEKLSIEYKGMDEKALRENIKDDFKFKDKVKIAKNKNEVEYSLFGKKIIAKIEENKDDRTFPQIPKIAGKAKESSSRVSTIPAVIKLIENFKRYRVPSDQLDIMKEIDYARDSNGQDIDFKNIHVKLNGTPINKTILESQKKPSKIKIEYSYEDPITKWVIEELELEFYQEEAKISAKAPKELLFTLPTNENYNVNYEANISNLINQLNNLPIEKYKEVIACSLRVMFETGIDAVIGSVKYNKKFTSTKPADKVEEIVKYLKNGRNMEYFSKATGLDFHTNNNLLREDIIKKAFESSNLGAHKGGKLLTEIDIKHIAKKAGIFAVIVNELLNNNNIN